MRIAYVALHLSSSILYGGVGKKIQTHIQNWKLLGHETHLFLLSPDEIEVPNSSLVHFKSESSLPILKSISREIERSKGLDLLLRKIREYTPDIIYLRYGLFCLPLQNLFTIAPVVVELNTLDQQEYKYRGAFFYWVNRFGRKILLSGANGLAAVSKEIANDPTNAHFHKPTIVISNGIELDDYPELPCPMHQTPNLVFIGTQGYPWHGVDKLFSLARKYPDLHFDIIGYSAEVFSLNSIPINITFHGFLKTIEIQKIFSRSDVAIGTLAWHRNQMFEGSPLKVREYLANGLPVILGYCDTDLSSTIGDFILEIPNTEDNVEKHADEIRDFAYQMMGKRVDRNLIAPLIDQSLKEKKRLEFFAQIIGKHEI